MTKRMEIAALAASLACYEIDLDYSSAPGGDRPEIRDAVGSLGLRLDLSTTPMEFFVIEHVERPSAN